MKLYVVAPNYHFFKKWLQRQNFRSNRYVSYVSQVEMFMGLEFAPVLLLEHSNDRQIMDELYRLEKLGVVCFVRPNKLIQEEEE